MTTQNYREPVVSSAQTSSIRRLGISSDASAERELTAPQNRDKPSRPQRVRCAKEQLLSKFPPLKMLWRLKYYINLSTPGQTTHIRISYMKTKEIRLHARRQSLARWLLLVHILHRDRRSSVQASRALPRPKKNQPHIKAPNHVAMQYQRKISTATLFDVVTPVISYQPISKKPYTRWLFLRRYWLRRTHHGRPSRTASRAILWRTSEVKSAMSQERNVRTHLPHPKFQATAKQRPNEQPSLSSFDHHSLCVHTNWDADETAFLSTPRKAFLPNPQVLIFFLILNHGMLWKESSSSL